MSLRVLRQYSFCIISASSSQLFTEYGRLAMDEIFLKPFQVRKTTGIDKLLLMLDVYLIAFVSLFD